MVHRDFAAALLGLGGLAAVALTVDKGFGKVVEGTIIKVLRLLVMPAPCSYCCDWGWQCPGPQNFRYSSLLVEPGTEADTCEAAYNGQGRCGEQEECL